MIKIFESIDKAGAEKGLDWSQGLLLVFGLLLVIGLIGEWRKSKAERWRGLGDLFELLVIIGVAGELFFDGLIFGYSGRLSRIQDDAVATMAIALQVLQDKNSEFEATNAALQQKFEQSQKDLVRAFVVSTGDRSINSTERARLEDSLKGKKYDVTVVLIDNREARQYANAIISALISAGVNVRKEESRTLPDNGVIVCRKGHREADFVKILNVAAIEAKLSSTGAKRPETCDRAPPGEVTDIGSFFGAVFGNNGEPRGIVMLVGEKKPKEVSPLLPKQ